MASRSAWVLKLVSAAGKAIGRSVLIVTVSGIVVGVVVSIFRVVFAELEAAYEVGTKRGGFVLGGVRIGAVSVLLRTVVSTATVAPVAFAGIGAAYVFGGGAI